MPKHFQQANLFDLNGRDIKVTYSSSSLEGTPQFNYRDSNINRLFSGKQIHRGKSEIGDLLTVTLEQIPELRTVTFTLILPIVNVVPGSKATHIQLLGIKTTTHSGITGEVSGQAKTYFQVSLKGTAQVVIT